MVATTMPAPPDASWPEAPPVPSTPLSQSWHRALFDHASHLVIVLDADGTRRAVSPSVERLLGYPMATYLAFSTFELIHPDDHAIIRAGHADCLAHPGPQAPVRYRVRHADGSWRTFESIRTNLLHDPAVRGIVIEGRDVTDAERARLALHASEARFRAAFASAAIGMILVGLDGRFLDANPAFCRLVGYPLRELVALTFLDITHPDDLAADLAHRADLLAGRTDGYQMEKRYCRKGGATVWVVLSVALVRDEAGRPVHYVAQVHDVTARKAAEQTIRDSEARFRALLARAADIVLLLDDRGRVRWASPSVETVLGVQPGNLIGRSNVELVHADDRAALRRAFVATGRAPGRPAIATLRFRHADGGFRWLEAVATNHLDDPAVAGMVVNARDVSDRVALEEHLRRDARHDPLTGLANRAGLAEALDRALAGGAPLAVLALDLDGFKHVNDTLGHAAGDAVLVEVADRLRAIVPPEGTVARPGGDEFVLLLPGATENGARAVAEAILPAIAAPIDADGTVAAVRTSVGIARGAGVDPADLLRRADSALYAAKRTGGNIVATGPE